MIHFTPVQTLGESGSCYSIAKQLVLEPTLFPASVIEQANAAATATEAEVGGDMYYMPMCEIGGPFHTHMMVYGCVHGDRRLKFEQWQPVLRHWRRSKAC